MTAAYLIVLLAALAVSALEQQCRPLDLVSLALCGAATLLCVSVLGVVWLVGLIPFLLVLTITDGPRRAIVSLTIITGCVLAFAIPAIANAVSFIKGAAASDA
jgi:hypothetical protein